jgi:hypothetical protein
VAPCLLAILAGCVTLPGEPARPDFVPRIVDREYGVVWNTVLAALRNEGAKLASSDRDRGLVETSFQWRDGTRVLGKGLLGQERTRNVPVQVRHSVRTRALGAEKTEVSLRTEVQYLDQGTGTWVRVLDDGTLTESFWRRFEQDLTYYGARPDTWRPDEPRPVPPASSAGPPGALGRQAPGPGPEPDAR